MMRCLLFFISDILVSTLRLGEPGPQIQVPRHGRSCVELLSLFLSDECTRGKKAARHRGDHSLIYHIFQIQIVLIYSKQIRSLLSTMTSVMATTRLLLQASISLVRCNFVVIFYKIKSAPGHSTRAGSSTWRRKQTSNMTKGLQVINIRSMLYPMSFHHFKCILDQFPNVECCGISNILGLIVRFCIRSALWFCC